MHAVKADIAEIFSSIQGEGIFLGAKQVFVRFADCNLDCLFCDEKALAKAKEYGPVELMKEVRSLEESNGPHHSVSLTGGEPLLYWDFLRWFLKILRRGRILRSYLETNGTLPHELSKVIELVDIIAMDIKLPSSTCAKPFWDEHAEFLKIASRKKVFVKVVVTADTVKEDIEKAIDIVKKLDKDIPFIIQPASAVRKYDKPIASDRLFSFMELGLKKDLGNVRIIPQVHKLLRVK